ncbi:MAG TPA: MFS transporter [Acidimicrobiales bacterium]|nr:MFS transporter [Acidimicrobiales bacterium]
MENKWWTLLAVCTGTFMLLLDVTIVVVALPPIQTGLHADFNDVEWVIDAYALTLASLLLTAGVLADRYGRRLLFAIGMVIFTLGSLTCGLAQSPVMLIISRSGQGVGGAIMFATSLALLAHAFRGKDRGVAFGVWGAITGVAVSLGPILGGAITTGISWRGIFLVNVPIGVAGVVVTIWKVDESRDAHPGQPDWPGFVLLTAGLISLVYGLIRASETSWSHGSVIVTLAAGAVLLVGFVAVEARGRHPMFDLSLFRTPTFVGGLVSAFTMNGSLFAMFLYLVIYLQDILGYSALRTGLYLLTSTGGMFVAAAVSGRLSEHVPVRYLIAPGLALVGLGLLLMTGLSGTSTWEHLLPGLIVSGVGSGLVNPPLASTAVGVVSPQRAGMASGVNSTFRQVGFAVSVAALGSVFAPEIQSKLGSRLAGVPALARRTGQLVTALRQGEVGQAIHSTPPHLQGYLAAAIKASFASAVNDLVLITGVVALAGALGAALLIRRKDFVVRTEPSELAPVPA